MIDSWFSTSILQHSLMVFSLEETWKQCVGSLLSERFHYQVGPLFQHYQEGKITSQDFRKKLLELLRLYYKKTGITQGNFLSGLEKVVKDQQKKKLIIHPHPLKKELLSLFKHAQLLVSTSSVHLIAELYDKWNKPVHLHSMVTEKIVSTKNLITLISLSHQMDELDWFREEVDWEQVQINRLEKLRKQLSRYALNKPIVILTSNRQDILFQDFIEGVLEENQSVNQSFRSIYFVQVEPCERKKYQTGAVSICLSDFYEEILVSPHYDKPRKHPHKTFDASHTVTRKWVRVVRRLLGVLFFLITIILGIWGMFQYSPAKINGPSMEPTLLSSDIVLLKKPSVLQRSDIVAIRSTETDDATLIKRVIGLPGDTVELEEGILYVNGKESSEPYVKKTKDSSIKDFSLLELTHNGIVPKDKLFVLGDNREQSKDSRTIGFVGLEDILGVPAVRVWPLTEWTVFNKP